jgi:hypothetical protein
MSRAIPWLNACADANCNVQAARGATRSTQLHSAVRCTACKHNATGPRFAADALNNYTCINRMPTGDATVLWCNNTFGAGRWHCRHALHLRRCSDRSARTCAFLLGRMILLSGMLWLPASLLCPLWAYAGSWMLDPAEQQQVNTSCKPSISLSQESQPIVCILL